MRKDNRNNNSLPFKEVLLLLASLLYSLLPSSVEIFPNVWPTLSILRCYVKEEQNSKILFKDFGVALGLALYFLMCCLDFEKLYK